MSTLKVTGKLDKMSSSWRCDGGKFTDASGYYIPGGTKWKIVSGPSKASQTVSFKYSIPSGSKINSAKLFADVTGGNISVLTANGATLSKTKGKTRSAKLKLSGTSGTLKVKVVFRASGSVYKDTRTRSSSVTFSKVYLLIDYGKSTSGNSGSSGTNEPGFKVPPQSTCIYDQKTKAVYLFDGVTKIQHSISVDIQEKPESDKNKYVNNAKNEPDKVTLDVVMSDVYSGGGSIFNHTKMSKKMKTAWNATKNQMTARESKSAMSRSEKAYYTLHWLKEQRHKVSVITPQFIYVNMIVASFTVNQDDACPFGWEGQMVLQEAFESAASKRNASQQKTEDGSKKPSESLIPEMKGVRS